MKNTLLIYQASIWAGLKVFKEKEFAKQLVIYAFLLLVVALTIGSFFFFKGLFGFLVEEEARVGVLVFYTLGVSFLITFFLLLFSSLLFFSGFLYKGETNRLIQTLPVSSAEHFSAKFISGSIVSLWPILVLGGPALLASFTVLENISIISGTILLFSLAAFSMIAVSLAASMIIIFSRFFGRLFKTALLILIIVTTPFITWWVANLLFPGGLEQTFAAQVDQSIQSLFDLGLFSSLLPSTWLIKVVWGAHQGQGLLPTLDLLHVWIVFFVTLILAIFLGLLLYQRSLAKMGEGTFLAGSGEKVNPAKSFEVSGSKFELLLQKEILTFFRDWTSVGYLVFLFFIGSIYIFTLSKTPTIYNMKPTLAAFLLSSNIAFISYLGLVATLRFLYPGVSLEGKSTWILYSLPFEVKNWLASKLLFFGGLVFVFGVLLGMFSSRFLGSDGQLTWAIVLVVILAIGFAAVSNLSIGALLPNFHEEGAESAATSTGGILSTLINLGVIFSISAISFFFFESYLIALPYSNSNLTSFWVTMFMAAALLIFVGYSLFNSAKIKLKAPQ